MTLAPALLAAALAASAAGDDLAATAKAADILDPEMARELAGVESANLANAMAKGRTEAEKAGAHLSALMFSARALADALKADLAPFSDEDAAEDLALHAAALKEKDAAFRRALAAADLKAPGNDGEKLMAQRRGYPAADRRRDLRLAEDFLKAADLKRKGVKPSAAARVALDAAAAFSSEAAALERLAGSLDARLSPRRAADPKLGPALESAKPRRLALGADVAALKGETRLFELSAALAAHDDADFDASPPKAAQEDE
jgi:hypothetical protein